MRSPSAGFLSAIQQPNGFGVILLLEMYLDATVYMCSAGFDVSYGGQTYAGAGEVGSIATVDDSAGERQALQLVLSSVPLDYLALAMDPGYRGKRIKIREAIYTDAGIVDAPQIWSGSLDQMTITEGPQTGAISITAEHRGTTFARAKPLRYTDGDQQKVSPGDRCLQFIVSQANHIDVWPAAAWFRQ